MTYTMAKVENLKDMLENAYNTCDQGEKVAMLSGLVEFTEYLKAQA